MAGETFTVIATLASIAAGVISALAMRSSAARSKRKREKEARELDVGRVEEALSSDDLGTLGKYVYEGFGDVSVEGFAQDLDTRKSVDQVFSMLKQYLGATPSPQPPIAEPDWRGDPNAEVLDVEPEFRVAFDEINRGDVWNGLARLRRALEIRLRGFAEQSGLATKWTGAGQIVNALGHKNIIDYETKTALRYAIEIANRGVHGVDVAQDQAIEALFSAAHALEGLTTKNDDERSESDDILLETR